MKWIIILFSIRTYVIYDSNIPKQILGCNLEMRSVLLFFFDSREARLNLILIIDFCTILVAYYVQHCCAIFVNVPMFYSILK